MKKIIWRFQDLGSMFPLSNVHIRGMLSFCSTRQERFGHFGECLWTWWSSMAHHCFHTNFQAVFRRCFPKNINTPFRKQCVSHSCQKSNKTSGYFILYLFFKYRISARFWFTLLSQEQKNISPGTGTEMEKRQDVVLEEGGDYLSWLLVGIRKSLLF